MEQSWPSQGYYNYFPHDPNRPTDRPNNTSPNPNGPDPELDNSHRRSYPGAPQFAVPPPHQQQGPPPGHNSSAMNLPPFGSTFYGAGSGSYHSPTGTHPGLAGGPGGVAHMPSHNMGGYGGSSHVMGNQGYHYPMASPPISIGGGGNNSGPNGNMGNHRAPPPHSYSESPRLAGGYSSSPGFRHLSPTSPTTHLIPPGMGPSTSSTSSSSFPPSATRPPAGLPKSQGGPGVVGKRRSGSLSQSESWDEGDSSRAGKDRDDDEQPWGMPQEEYKALNPRDKKQVRNRIGARRFRAKRKDYVSNLEGNLRAREDEVHQLRAQLDASRAEINDLRQRLGLPLNTPDGGLGLVVQGDAGWHDVKPDATKD